MFDVYYFGPKPNLFAFEKFAKDIYDAARQSTTGPYWFIYGGNDYRNFDFEFRPQPGQENFIHVWPDQHNNDGYTYFVPLATADRLYHTEPKLHRLPELDYYFIPDNIDEKTIDKRWSPNPLDPPYIYHFPSQHQSSSGVTYTVPGATDIKLVDAFVVKSISTDSNWQIKIPIDSFDFSWHPNPLDPPYNYIFGNQWNHSIIEPTVVYYMGESCPEKFMDITAKVAPQKEKWRLLDDIIEFDYSWRPNPTDPPYIYVFGNQWMTPEYRPALEYQVLGAVERKYMSEPRAQRVGDKSKFNINVDCQFDWSWEPDPHSPPYIYVFGNQWYPAEIMPTVEYHVPGATERKFVDSPRAQLPVSTDNWKTIVDCQWDYSWVPDPGDPPLIYVFGNQHWPAVKMPTVEYHVPGAVERKYMDAPIAQLLDDREHWTVPEGVDETNIDFSWVPDPNEQPYIYHFGSDYQISLGLTYTVPGATEPKFAGEPPKKQQEKAVIDTLDIFFIDHGNIAAQSRYDRLTAQYKHVQKVRYANSMLDTITRCCRRSHTNKFWVISSEYDYADFDFRWHPAPWQQSMTHVFPSQHQQWSNTFLINRWEFERHSQWANGLEQFPNLNFVTDQTVKKTDNNCDIFYIDHGNPESDDQCRDLVQKLAQNVVKTRFVDNYLATFRRIMSVAETEYVWIVNSICDYQYFDFTWEPEPWQREMIHVFPSGLQDRGDTFYIHVESFKQQIAELEILDWFNVINYCRDQQVQRFPAPVVNYEGDNLISAIKEYQFTAPYALFRNYNPIFLPQIDPCLWSERDRVVTRHNTSGSISLVPRDIKRYLQTQIYDYPYIDPNRRFPWADTPLDIIYISNGEPDEAKWYEHTCRMTDNDIGDVKWIRGVNGRTAAYQAAAQASTTPWFFAVFAKLEVVGDEFDWRNWQPDYFQGPKHYIFRARNPMNGLEYGHQGVIAYNKNLVLSNNNPGIDFTLSQPHESVPITLGTAHFNQDPWMTWRTAFREVVKLKHFMAVDPTVETEHRLHVWTTQASGDYAEYCLAGARDAVEYYEEVSGDYEKLKLSFEWAWLRERFNGKN